MKLEQAEILTYSGRMVRPFAMTAADIVIDDVAQGLANKCRWTGQTRDFLSIAQHSVFVYRLCGHPWGLLHDAAEAYLPDMPRTYKRFFPEIVAAEERILLAVAEVFDLPATMPAAVHEADGVVLATEARDLIGLPINHHTVSKWKPTAEGIVPVDPRTARAMFLREFHKLTRGHALRRSA